jgi:sulfur-oxidizing protein SoxY
MKRTQGKGHSRRDVLAAAAGLASVLALRPARATSETMEAAIRAFTGEAQMRTGKVKLDVPPLVENGNVVPLTVMVESPMTEADYVKAIAIFNEKNPQPNVAVFHLGPRCGRGNVATRLRLANSQKLIAVAEMSDGTFWSDSADVIVTLAACTEES